MTADASSGTSLTASNALPLSADPSVAERELERLYALHFWPLVKFARSQGAEPDDEDVVQIAFTKFYERMTRADARPMFSPKSLLYHLVNKEVLALLRTRQRRTEILQWKVGPSPTLKDEPEEAEYRSDPLISAARHWVSPWHEVLREELRTRIDQETQMLDERERLLFVLVALDEQTIREAAATVGLSYDRTRVILERVVHKLGLRLQDLGLAPTGAEEVPPLPEPKRKKRGSRDTASEAQRKVRHA